MKLNEVTKRNVEVMAKELDTLLDKTMDEIRPYALKVGLNYSKEQLLLEARATMLINAISALGAYLESDSLTPQKFEDIIKAEGDDPKKLSESYRQDIAKFHMIHKLDMEAFERALAHMVTDSLMNEIFKK